MNTASNAEYCLHILIIEESKTRSSRYIWGQAMIRKQLFGGA